MEALIITSIPLTFDRIKHLYSVPALIYLGGNKGKVLEVNRGNPNVTYHNTLMYIDTGSTVTSITDTDARAMGLDLKSLELELTGGVGGFSWVPYVENVNFLLQGNNNSFGLFTLDRVGVTASKPKERKTVGKGNSRTSVRSGEFFPLLGMDALEKMSGELRLNPAKLTGEILLSR